MSARIARTIALGVGAGALVLGTAAPAFAADTTIDRLPGKATISTSEKVTVAIPVANQPAGFACGTANVTWVARVPGKQDAIRLNGGLVPVTAVCGAENVLGLTVTSNQDSAKKNAVVKFIATNNNGTVDTTDDDTRAVMTLVVKVTGKTGNPGKGPKN